MIDVKKDKKKTLIAKRIKAKRHFFFVKCKLLRFKSSHDDPGKEEKDIV